VIGALIQSFDADSTGRERRRLVRAVLDRRARELPLSAHELARGVTVALVGSDHQRRAFDHVLSRLHYRDVPQLVEITAISYNRTDMTVDVAGDQSVDRPDRRVDERSTDGRSGGASLVGRTSRSKLR
jgi:hypothetical protein